MTWQELVNATDKQSLDLQENVIDQYEMDRLIFDNPPRQNEINAQLDQLKELSQALTNGLNTMHPYAADLMSMATVKRGVDEVRCANPTDVMSEETIAALKEPFLAFIPVEHDVRCVIKNLRHLLALFNHMVRSTERAEFPRGRRQNWHNERLVQNLDEFFKRHGWPESAFDQVLCVVLDAVGVNVHTSFLALAHRIRKPAR
jgi:hypothetical protein